MALPIAAVAFSGCSLFRPGSGPAKGGYVIDAEAADQAQASRRAVAAFFDAFVSSSSVVRAEILAAGTTTYVTRSETLSSRLAGGAPLVKVRCLVDYPRLGKDLEDAGLVKPEGVVGRAKAALWISENGPGADPSVGRAAGALRAALARRGYETYSLAGAKTEASALARAKEQRAALLFAGEARATADADAALSGFNAYDASLELKIYALPEAEIVDDVSVSASAIDLAVESAAAKALENAGELAADKLARFLPTRFVERSEMSVLVLGLGGLSESVKLLTALRRERGVVAAALSQLGGGDAKLRVWVERLSADELAADFLKIPGYSFTVRSVEPEFNSVELDAFGEAPL